MPQLELFTEDFQLETANFRRIRLENMYAIQNPLAESGFSLVTRPVLSKLALIGSGPIRGMWKNETAEENSFYVVSGTTLYVCNSLGASVEIGQIPGSGDCTFASTLFYIAILSSSGLYLLANGVLTSVALPDNLTPTSVVSFDNYFYVTARNSTKYFWLRPGENYIDPLSFASAERNPDNLVKMIRTGDEIWALGTHTAEVLVRSGDSNAPLSRIPGRYYEYGCLSKDTVASSISPAGECLIWVTPEKDVVIARGDITIISNEYVTEVLSQAESIKSWTLEDKSHRFYILTTEAATLVFDITTSKWVRWFSYGLTYFLANNSLKVGDKTYASVLNSNYLWLLGRGTADENDFLVCTATGFIKHLNKIPLQCSDCTVFLSNGVSSSYVTNPEIEIRWSDDGGNTWSPYISATTGLMGEYTAEARFRSLGLIKKPGRRFEFRFSEKEPFRLDEVVYND